MSGTRAAFQAPVITVRVYPSQAVSDWPVIRKMAIYGYLPRHYRPAAGKCANVLDWARPAIAQEHIGHMPLMGRRHMAAG
jgi:hypothetical protein